MKLKTKQAITFKKKSYNKESHKMKRIFLVVAILILMVGNAFAASSIVLVPPVYESQDKNQMVITLLCTAHTDGTFDSKILTNTVVGFDYYNKGYYIIDAFAVNSATDDHTNAAVVTITDATGHQLIGATAGDTLSLSQTASAIAYLSIDRGRGQRAVTSYLTVAIADTGSTATVQTLYIVLGK
jgi:hypothetical protein